MSNRVACVDFGSTFTKALLVDVDEVRLLGSAAHRTTLDSDVMDGWAACAAKLGAGDADVLACSSAGGGLRIAVVGNEELVTAEAGRRVALSSGGVVVHVAAGLAQGTGALAAVGPDVVLLVGGTDGGNAEVLLECAGVLAAARWPTPVVVAGDSSAAEEVSDILRGGGVAHRVADNVLPRIGVLAPDSARTSIRSVFVEHVIGGKHLSHSDAFHSAVRGATPDVVLAGVELLGALAGDVAVVDVGGATTDVHSVVEVDPDQAHGLGPVVGATAVNRTVEADLGMRWSASSTYDHAVATGLTGADPELATAAAARTAEPGWLPESAAEKAADARLAAYAIGVALRRHAGRARVSFGPDGRVVERSGTDLREVDLLVGSGGVLRHAATTGAGVEAAAEKVLRSATGDHVEGGWRLPRSPRIVVDVDYVLAAAGLLAEELPLVARTLLQRHLLSGRDGRRS